MQILASPQDFGAFLRTRRKALGYSQASLAALCNTGTRFISDMENGKETIELGKSLRVAQALGIDLVAHIRGEQS